MCLPCVIWPFCKSQFPRRVFLLVIVSLYFFFVLSHKILIYVVCRMSGTPKSDKKYVKLPLTSSRLQLQSTRCWTGTRNTYTERDRKSCVHIYLASMIAETMPTNYINHSKCHVLNRAQDTSDTLDTRQRDKRQTTARQTTCEWTWSTSWSKHSTDLQLLGLREAGGEAVKGLSPHCQSN